MKIPAIAFTGFVLGALLMLLVLQTCQQPCPDAVITKHWTDTVFVKEKDVVPVIAESKPAPRKITTTPKSPKGDLKGKINSAFSLSGIASDSVSVSKSGGVLPSTPTLPETDCSALVEYEDTLYKPDLYKAILYEVVSDNKIQHRSIRFYNLMPGVIEHTEKTIPPRETVKVYAGAFSGFGRNYTGGKWNWSIGPEVMLSVPFGLMAGYGFDAKNNMHQVQLLYKIKLKK